MRGHLAHADVSALPSLFFEGVPTAILEAMAMEKAVICSRTPGQTDVIVDGETGMYISPEEPTALREAIQNLLDHPGKCAEFGKKGRQRILEQMCLEHYVERLLTYIDELSCTEKSYLLKSDCEEMPG